MYDYTGVVAVVVGFYGGGDGCGKGELPSLCTIRIISSPLRDTRYMYNNV